MNWLQIVQILGPLVLQLIPELSAALHPAIVQGVVNAEEVGGTSEEKLASVLAQPELKGHETSAVIKGVNALVAAANAVSSLPLPVRGKVKAVAPTAVPG